VPDDDGSTNTNDSAAEDQESTQPPTEPEGNVGREPAEAEGSDSQTTDSSDPESDDSESGDSDLDDGEVDGIDALPAWARDEILNGRRQSMKYRRRAQEAERQLSKVETSPEVSALETKIAELERELQRRDVADTVKLPAKLGKYVQGNTVEEMTKSAEELKQFAGAPAIPPLGGGLKPELGNGEDLNPRKLVAHYGR
jgi:hypothetical protein